MFKYYVTKKLKKKSKKNFMLYNIVKKIATMNSIFLFQNHPLCSLCLNMRTSVINDELIQCDR